MSETMREILFRGKRIDNGEWVDGSLFCFDARREAAIIQSDSAACFDVDPATVSQYTGLKDKNGRKIFEGDRVKFHKCGGIIGKFGMTVTEFEEQKGCGANSKPNYQDDGEPFSPDCYEVLT